MKRETPIIYYRDALGDEFSTAKITPRPIGDAYVYLHRSAWKRFTHFFWYRVVATPLAWLYLKVAFGHRVRNKRVLRAVKSGQGYFLFGNHTQATADAFIPTMLSTPRDAYVIVHPNNVSMPYLGRITPSLGALPLPDSPGAARRFLEAVRQRLAEGQTVALYPEAHIWPYYTGIRPFTDKAFQYPVRYGSPVFCFTNTYQKRRFFRRPKMVTYVDGPFYPNEALAPAARRQELRDRVYAAMCERSRLSTVEWVAYRPCKDRGEMEK